MPGPLIRKPVDNASITRRKQSPGLSGIPADEITFSTNSSIACRVEFWFRINRRNILFGTCLPIGLAAAKLALADTNHGEFS